MPFQDDLLSDTMREKPFEPERMFREEAILNPRGWLGLDISNYGMFNPDEIPISTYKKMMKDTQVGAAFDIVRMSVLFVDWHINYDGQDPVIRDEIVPWLERELSEVNSHFGSSKGIDHVLWEMMTATAYGFSVGEVVFRRPNNFEDRVGLSRLKVLDPDTIQAIRTDEHSNLIEVRQNPIGSGRAGSNNALIGGVSGISLDPRKLLVHSYNMEFGNWWGTPDFRRLYEPWFIKQFVQKFWNIALEKFGMPYVVGKVQDNDAVNAMLSKLNSLQKRSNVAISEGQSIEMLKGVVARGEFMEAIEYQDKRIMRGLLIPDMVFQQGEVGAYAQSQTHFKTFLMRIRSLQKGLQGVMDKLVKVLVDYNYSGVDTYPVFRFDEPSGEDTAQLATVFNSAINGGYVDPVTDMPWMRERLGFPEPTPEMRERMEQREREQAMLAQMQQAQPPVEEPVSG